MFDLNEDQKEFLYLCTLLKINPPVVKDFNCTGMSASAASGIQEDETDDGNIPSSVHAIVPYAEVITSDENISGETQGSEEEYLVRDEATEVCDPENNYLENLESPPRLSEDGSSDEETPEHISDFLNQMMPPTNVEEESRNKSPKETDCLLSIQQHMENEIENEKSQENLLSNSKCFEEELSSDTFKMPDSFDIPSEYIQEILPNKVLSTSVKNEASPIKNLGNMSPGSGAETPPKSGTVKTFNQKVDKSKTGDGKLNFDDILSDAILENDNTPVQDDVAQAQVQLTTYKKDSSAKRNQGIKGNINPKRDRKKIMAALFNESDSSDSETEEQSSSERKKNIVEDLEEKKNRMKLKLKHSSENVPKKGTNSVRDELRKILSSTPSSSSSSKKRNEEDEKFIVPDNEVSISDPSSSEIEDDPSNQDSDEDIRSKRLDDRKKKKGGDVLAWMNRRASVKVVVQNSPKFNIIERSQYRLKLLADESKDSDSDIEPSPSSKDEKRRKNDSSDDSIPRGRRIRGLQSSSESDSEERKRKKKKLKKKSKISREEREESFPVPVDEVVWTPDMYRKWDSMSVKKRSGDKDTNKIKKKKIKRSHSIDLKMSSLANKSSDKHKFNRSVSTIEASSSQTTPTKPKSHIPWPNATNLPKIPKLKKSD